VTDGTGASIAGAQVNLREITTNVTLKTTTNAADLYYLPALPPGQYKIRVEQKGFRATVISGIVLGAGRAQLPFGTKRSLAVTIVLTLGRPTPLFGKVHNCTLYQILGTKLAHRVC
jgi:hypothetical protein